jgi:hypothetical protein
MNARRMHRCLAFMLTAALAGPRARPGSAEAPQDGKNTRAGAGIAQPLRDR